MESVPQTKSLHLDYMLSSEDSVEERLAVVVGGTDAARDFLRQYSRLDDRDIFALLVVYEELTTNVARHAVRPGHRPVRLIAQFTIAPSTVSLDNKDDGPAFNSQDGSPKIPGIEGGQGLNLLCGYFPDTRYRRHDGLNIVRVEKKRPTACNDIMPQS